ncbi:MAG: UDP-N-acetylmuramoyl-tripeptide--D-alanyl-D-alanine ligase [Clostridia bacterium]|nr:UDP-N-acetylmuramoyl-tripeptide--D-alanyl-D-alanine ligase [Clostridia bacterium]
MNDLKVKEVLENKIGRLITGNKEDIIENIKLDSRQVENGDTYLALKGDNIDGSIYYKEAIKNGARVCIVNNIDISDEEKEMYKNNTIIQVKDTKDAIVEMAKLKREKYDIPVIGVTGSVGKTSTKDTIATVVSKKYNVYKTQGNYNNRMGVPLTILALKDHTALVIEMGMNHLGEISELTKIAKPTLAVISNVGTSHIGNLGSRENILKAKLEILDGMSKDGKIIINNDNDLLHKWSQEDNKYNKITFGIKEKSDYMATDTQIGETTSSFKYDDIDFETNKAGEPFIYNALSAIAVGTELGIPMDDINEALRNIEFTKDRMDIEKIGEITFIKDYYNASYESIKPSLEYLSNIKEGLKIAVLGDVKELGEYSKELHEKIGEEVAKNKIDILITVGEDAKYIAKKAEEKGQKNIYTCETNKEAAEYLKKYKNTKATILLKASHSMNFGEILELYKK